MYKNVTSCLWEFRNCWVSVSVSVNVNVQFPLSESFMLSLFLLTGSSKGLPPHSCPGKRGQEHRVASG